MSLPRKCCTSFLSVCLLLPFAAAFPAVAYADGGAPQLAYVAGATRGVGVINIAQRRVSGSIAVSGNPRTILLSLDGAWLYVTQPALGQVAVIAASTGKTLCTAHTPGQPSFLALSKDATVLYAAGQDSTKVYAINPTNCAIQRTFDTHEAIYGLAVAASVAPNATPSTPNQIWITGTTMLTVFDATGHLLGTVPIPGGPENISIPGGFTAYVTTRQGTVVAVDLNTRKVIRTLLSGGQFGTMDYDDTTGEVYVPDEQHNQLDVLSPVTTDTPASTKEPIRVFHLDASPQSVAITNDGQLGFVALSNGHVLMLDIIGRSILATIAVGGTPHFVITGVYPPATSSIATTPQITSSSPPPASNNLFPLITLIVLAAILLPGTLWLTWRYYLKSSAAQRPTDKHP